jgi:hypothetical protein
MPDQFHSPNKMPAHGAPRHFLTVGFNWIAALLMFAGGSGAWAAVRHVDLNNSGPLAPYTSWATAATNIQDAVDAAVPGDLILVTNGIYQTGRRLAVGSTSNRVAVTKAVTVQSVNGPSDTVIKGFWVPGTTNGIGAVRGVYLTNGAVLSGFTVTGGATQFGGDTGGGVRCQSASATISNCVLIGNASPDGGGAYQGTLRRCTIANNRALSNGGGTYSSVLNSCIVVSNQSGYVGGAAMGGELNNCLVYGNWAASSGGGTYYALHLNNCTVVNNSTGSEGGGIYTSSVSNCIVYYNSAGASGTENIFNSTAVYNCCTTPTTFMPPGNFSQAPVFVNLAGNDFHLQPWSPCINAGNNAGAPWSTDLDGNPRIVNGAVDVGAYEFQSAVRFVRFNSPTPTPPYSNWLTAARVIQDAVDVSGPGDLVLVTNGTYGTGGRAVGPFDVTNRVVVTNAVKVLSMNGPAVTTILGRRTGVNDLTNAARCVFLGSNAMISGFTLTNGQAGVGNYVNGGAISGTLFGGDVVSNCVVIGNAAAGAGGGAFRGTLRDCILTDNHAGGGGAASDTALINCITTNNSAGWAAGVLGSQATNCIFAGNLATNYGGASGFSTLVNCTVVGNSLQPGLGGNGGGSYHDSLFNCIVYDNTAPNGSNYSGSSMTYCCSAPLPGGAGNFSSPPLLMNPAGADLRLQSVSPCINSGQNSYMLLALDLAGSPRVRGGTVDVGAYEFQSPGSVLSYAWAQQYGLPTDGSADYADPDADAMNTWQEWRAGTVPTDAGSLLRMFSPANATPGVAVSWQSVSGINYFLQRTGNLQSPFTTIQSSIVGQAGSTTFTDNSAVGVGPFFYRVGVQ